MKRSTYIKSEQNRLNELPKYIVRGHSAITNIKKIEIPTDTYVIFFVKSGRKAVSTHKKYANLFKAFSSKTELNTLVSDMLINKSKYNDMGFDIKYPGDKINDQSLYFSKQRTTERPALLGKIELPNSSIVNSYYTCGKIENTDKKLLSKIIETPGIYFIGTCRGLGNKNHYKVVQNLSINAKRRKINQEAMSMIYNKKERVLEINYNTIVNKLLNGQLLLRYELGKQLYLPSERLKDLKDKIKQMYIMSLQLKSFIESSKGINTKEAINAQKGIISNILNRSLLQSRENSNLKEIHKKVVTQYTSHSLAVYINMYIHKYGISLNNTYNIMYDLLHTDILLKGTPNKHNQNIVQNIQEKVKKINKKEFLTERDVKLIKEFGTTFSNIYDRINKQLLKTVIGYKRT